MNERFARAGVIARIELTHEPDFMLGSIEVRPSLREIAGAGWLETIDPRVMQVLVALARAEGRAVSRDDLIESCWDGLIVGEDAINRCIGRLRKAAEASGNAFTVEAIPRVGYRLQVAASLPAAPEPEHAAPLKEQPFSARPTEPSPSTEAPPTAPPMSTGATASGLSQREVTLLALLGAVLLLLLGGLGLVMLHSSASLEPQRNLPVEASIAVLPFQNLSSDKDTGYFAAGVQDEILTRLTKIGTLKVISRRSTDHFASQPDDLSEIANSLGVANILEGSVQKAGNTVHINVQLIRASTDTHLWAEVYDRKLNDIFAVEGEVATSIAAALNAKVTHSEKEAVTARLTDNPAAYDAYLRGLALYRKNDVTAENYRRTRDFLEQAVRLDPHFAAAWALLADDNAWQYFSGYDATDERRAAARAALDNALRLNPDLAEVQLAQANFQYHVERNYEGARRRFESLRNRWPHNADLLTMLGALARRQGQWSDALAYLHQAIVLDPLSPAPRRTAAALLIVNRNFPATLRILDDALDIWPDNLDFIGDKAAVYQELGQLNQAETLLKDLRPPPENIDAVSTIADQYIYSRRYAQGIESLQRLLQRNEASGPAKFGSAFLKLNLGDLRRLSGDTSGAKSNYAQARGELLDMAKRQSDDADLYDTLALVYCGLGDQYESLKYAELAIDLLPAEKDALVGPDYEITRARIEARFGDRERAIAALAHLLKIPSYLSPAILRLDPDFDALRGDRRFEALIDSPVDSQERGR